MRIVSKPAKSKRASMSNIPNTFAFTFIRNWLSDKQYEKEREEYFIGNLSSQEVSLAMKEIKWLSRNFKDLDIISVEDSSGNITQVIL
ncbi:MULTISPECIES: hypothetical protein [Paraclostridium]|uniref:Uncharacterized protein n=1 Tax=Paraclostridium bifermentans TaxID=1490 RepID=A0A1X2JEW4_PARBF|nr:MULTISPECIES: hypothetical protein [Paraclostridium]KGJ48751.1 hypothetical protein KD33_12440 [Clostridium sp. NCR]MCU9807278.1 hypothetical protein [Paraclostridium sp. AKS46]RDC48691.1 hypothetical protein DVA85_27630 [Acinetobacter sp. RIT592]MBN8049101.1 hypothetical protein [Paraclostridium bifermentans]MBS6509081.1 hypothetical protein [Paraclostridium bifermentans]